jgi:hypothetical protein
VGKPATAVQATLGVFLLAIGIAKLAGAADADRDRLAIAAGLWLVVGVVEVIGGLGLLAGLRVRRLAVPAALGVATLTAGAIGAHARAGDGPAAMLPAALVLGMALALAARRKRSRSGMARSDRAPTGSAA